MAKHKNSGFVVVIKILNKCNIERTFTKMKEEYSELSIMKQVCRGQALNMLELVDSFEDNEFQYAVTKHIPDGDLHRYVLKNWRYCPVPEKVTKMIMKQIVKAIAQLHERNILHRDIKEANILVSKHGSKLKVLLADFGIASQLPSKFATLLHPIGTTGYVPPEMLQHKRYGLPADIWSLGALMYSLLAMKCPFSARDEATIKKRVVNEPLDLESESLL